MEAVESLKLLQLPQLRQEFGLNPDHAARLSALPNQLTRSEDPLQDAAHIWQKWERSGFLTSNQLRRLKKLVWQNRGEAALANPDFRARLRLNQRQVAAIESTLAAVRADLDAMPKGTDRSLIKEKIGKKLTDILSLDQLRIWRHLIAEDPPAR